MKKKYGGLQLILDNVGGPFFLTLCIVILRLVRNQGMSPEAARTMMSSNFGSILILVGCFVCMILELTWFSQYAALQLMMGHTRKQLFVMFQWVKLGSAVLISLLSLGMGMLLGKNFNLFSAIGTLGILFLVQGLCEMAAALSMRFQRMVMVMILLLAGGIGFFTSYCTMMILKEGEVPALLSGEFFGEYPILLGGLILLVYVILAVISWILLRKAEVRQ